ncbi:MAG: hypothetical protein ACYTGG_07300 [Planctomycetota bacterium]|jgi:hypothetical protein
MRHRLAGIRIASLLALVGTCGGPAGCASSAHNEVAIQAYYDYDFAGARESLRAGAYLNNDEHVLLNNMRLGLASLADGDDTEAERTLGHAFELLSTAGLNADRTTAAVFLNEGVKIWKGEPFEQALAYHYVATLYALKGDWENARAAAANALFRLTDFGADQTPDSLVRSAAEDDDFLDTGYTAVDTDFALGFLMQAIASDLSGAGGMNEQLDAAVAIDPDLEPLAHTLRRRDYDTLLLVDYGKGPIKVAYGPDLALVKFITGEPDPGRLAVTADGVTLTVANPVCDVDAMARDHRWNNLEDVRRAKSFIGTALIVGGHLVASGGSRNDNNAQGLLGLGMIVAGLITKANARGDTRHLELLPRSIFLVPMHLETPADLRLHLNGDPEGEPDLVLPRVTPGSAAAPRVLYVRLQGREGPRPDWLVSSELRYGNDHDGVQPGDRPWILGGFDVSSPSPAALQAYRAAGLDGLTLRGLRDLYAADEILIGSGMERRPDVPRNPSYRHILEGGRGLFTPRPHSMGYKRLMYADQPPYRPRSELVRNRARRIRVEEQVAADFHRAMTEDSP